MTSGWGPGAHVLAPTTRGQEKQERVSKQATAIRAGHVAPPPFGVEPLNREGSRSSSTMGLRLSPVLGGRGALSGQNCTTS